MRRLSQDFIDSLKANEPGTVFDSALPGFGIRTTEAGKVIYIVRARAGAGRRVYYAIGPRDEHRLKDARDLAELALKDIRAGRDPAAERSARERAAAAGVMTIKELAARWLAEVVKPKRKPRTAADYQVLVDKRIGPELGHLTVARIAREDVIKWHAGMKSIPRRANYALATLKAMLNFAEDVGLRPAHSNPCRRIEMYRERARERFLSEAEIGKAAAAITEAEAEGKIGPHAAAGLRLALFTGARSGEIKAAKWSHFDRARKIIRLPDSKTNEPRTIHLSDAALEVLASVPRVGDFIIAGANEGGGFSNLSRAWAVARAYGGLEDVRLHDLRHSYASLAASRGVSLQMIGKLLGHKVAATTQRYAHLARDVVADINDQLGAAMTAAIQAPTSASNVVRLKRRKRGTADV